MSSIDFPHSAGGINASTPWPRRFLDGLTLAGLLLTLAILPLQSFQPELCIGMCVILVFLRSGQVAIEKTALMVWTPLHLTLLAFTGIAFFQLVPLPFRIHSSGFHHTFEGLPVALDQWHTITVDSRTTAKAAAVLTALIGSFFVATSIIHSRKRLRLLVNGFIVIGLSISLVVILDGVFPSAHSPLRRIDFLGFYDYSPNRLAGYLEMLFALPLAMVVAGERRGRRRVWYGAAASVIGIAVVFGRTTGGLLVLVVELMSVALLAVNQRHRNRAVRVWWPDRVWAGMGTLVIVGTIFGGAAWLGTQVTSQMIVSDVKANFPALAEWQQESPVSDYDLQYGRVGIWKSSLSMIADHPVLGVGLGAYPIAYERYDPGSGNVFVNAAHNDYLQALCETGLIGGGVMILFLTFLARLSRDALKSQEPLNRMVALGASVGCLGLLVHSLVDFHLQSPATALLFLMLIALLVSARRLEMAGDDHCMMEVPIRREKSGQVNVAWLERR